MGEYRTVPAGSVGVEKILNIDGHTVGYIEQVLSEEVPQWIADLGPETGSEAFPDYESALQRIMTYADEHPEFHID